MIATSSRKAVAGAAALAAIALAGCTPPHQNPSSEKVDTATTQDPNSLKGAGTATTSTSTATATNVTEANAAQEKETAEAAVAAAPVFNNCGATDLVRPDRLTVDCKNQDDFLENIVWEQWGEDLAEGTGTRVVVSPDNREEDVKVVLGNPEIIDGKPVFTTVSVNGQSVVPDNNY